MPVPMPPSMLSSEALVIWIFRIAMNAPIMAARMATQTAVEARAGWAMGVTGALAVARGAGAEGVRATSVMASPLRSRLRGKSREGGFRAARRSDCGLGLELGPGLDTRDHRHAGPQCYIRAVERDLDGDALHNLGEVAGGVVRWQQREFLAARRRKAVNVPKHGLAGEHVDVDCDALTGTHVAELGFLEVRDHIGTMRGHQRHQLRAGLHELPGAQGAVTD